MSNIKRVIFLIFCIGSIGYCYFGNSYGVYVYMLLGLAVIVGIGLNILLGLSGQISLGHVGFYALGAYTSAILMTKTGISFWAALPLACLITSSLGAILALTAVRVSGAYLAMVTIAFGFIVQNLAIRWRGLSGGSEGILSIPEPSLFGHILNQQEMASVIVIVAIASILFFAFLARSPWGLAMKAVRDSETAAESIGLNTITVRTVAFTLSAGLTGLAGALFSPTTNFVNPDSFSFMQSVLFLLVVVVGGSGRILGPLAGAAVVVLLPQFLSSLAQYQSLFFGLLLLGILRLAPEGIVGAIEDLLKRKPRPVNINKYYDIKQFLAKGVSNQTLNVENLCISFGGVAAVSNLGFTASQGKITSIIGPNGAGKTTVLNLICGFYKADYGTVSFGNEKNLIGTRCHGTARNGIARTFQTTQLFDKMTVIENMIIALQRGSLGSLLSGILHYSRHEKELQEIALGLLTFVGYHQPVFIRADTLSHVDKRLVEIARALALNPKVLMLDEPAAGLSFEDTERIGLLLRHIAQLGIAVILIEHDMKLIMGISDRVVVLDAGKKIAMGTPTEIRTDPVVLKAYLGEESVKKLSNKENRLKKYDNLLVIKNLSCGYGAIGVLDKISLTVNSGELVTILGANGAGKSTLMQSISGLLRPVNGEILFFGENISDAEAYKITIKGLVLIPEGRQIFPELSVIDNIKLGAYTRSMSRRNINMEVQEMLTRFPSLQRRSLKPAGLLSGGEQQMLAIARGLIAKPKILILDEPSLGLSPIMINELYSTLSQLRNEGLTILLVDQMAALALSIADRAYVIQSGQIVHEGTADEIRNDPALEQAYLGKGDNQLKVVS